MVVVGLYAGPVIIAGVVYFVAEMRASEEKTRERQSSSYEQRQPRQSSVDPKNAATVFMIQVIISFSI